MTTDERIAVLKSYGKFECGEHAPGVFYAKLHKLDTHKLPIVVDFGIIISDSLGSSLKEVVDNVYKYVAERMWHYVNPFDAGFYYCPYVPVINNITTITKV